jgi:catechol 2,3-dioxygenase-like lactoylglutathione lyase family enzyme
MKRPAPTAGMHHLALTVKDLQKVEDFYVNLMGMSVEWRPDADNVYLTSGSDNLALHRGDDDFEPAKHQSLDHLGFIIGDINEVDTWYDFLSNAGVPMLTQVKTHRDGARSFYCKDPAGHTVQIIYHPPLA